MSYKAVISDWNGTLYESSTDENLNKKIAYTVVDDTKAGLKKGRIWKIADAIRLLKAKNELKKRLRQYYDNERHLWEVYEPFNENVLKNKSIESIHAAVNEYAKETADKVDRRVVIQVRKLLDSMVSQALREAFQPR